MTQSTTRSALEAALNTLLTPDAFADYAPNGLQVEGRSEVRRVVTGVSANAALIEAALEVGADAIVVHHGFFWKNEPRTLTGVRARRVGALLRNDVSLFGYHLPLDAHPEVGNNAGLLRAIGCEPTATFPAGSSIDGWIGTCDARPVDDVIASIADACGQQPLVFRHGPSEVRTVGVCTGGGAGFFEPAVSAGVDMFVSGEPAEMSQGLASELGATYVAAGHHATERFGPQQLATWIGNRFGVDARFIDIANPV